MPLNPNLALVPMQGVQAQGNAIDKMFNTYYKSAGNARQNALLDLQTQGQEFNQGLQTDANNRAQETHGQSMEAGQFKIDQAQGEKIYRAFEGFDKLAPETRQAQIDFMMPELSKFGFDAEDVDMLMNDHGQAMAIMERFKPAQAELKTGRYRTFESEDGATYRFDSATGETTTIQEGETPDISILPEGLKKLVEGQPREIQQNAIKSYTNSDKFLDRIEDQSKTDAKDQAKLSNSTSVIKQIDSALDQTSVFTTGLGGLLSIVPGTDAKDLEATLDTIRANIGFDQLQSMRDNSPTGGALGNVTERELYRLESTIDSLDQLQSEPSMREALKTIKESYTIVRGAINGSITMPSTDEEYQGLPEGALFLDPDDGKLYRK